MLPFGEDLKVCLAIAEAVQLRAAAAAVRSAETRRNFAAERMG